MPRRRAPWDLKGSGLHSSIPLLTEQDGKRQKWMPLDSYRVWQGDKCLICNVSWSYVEWAQFNDDYHTIEQAFEGRDGTLIFRQVDHMGVCEIYGNEEGS